MFIIFLCPNSQGQRINYFTAALYCRKLFLRFFPFFLEHALIFFFFFFSCVLFSCPLSSDSMGTQILLYSWSAVDFCPGLFIPTVLVCSPFSPPSTCIDLCSLLFPLPSPSVFAGNSLYPEKYGLFGFNVFGAVLGVSFFPPLFFVSILFRFIH